MHILLTSMQAKCVKRQNAQIRTQLAKITALLVFPNYILDCVRLFGRKLGIRTDSEPLHLRYLPKGMAYHNHLCGYWAQIHTVG